MDIDSPSDAPATPAVASTAGTTTAATNATTATAAPTTDKPRPKRGGSKPILKVSGIQRVDNNLKSTLFGGAVQINQKNYYTDYLRRDDQIMFYREWNEEQKRLKEVKAKVPLPVSATGQPAPGGTGTGTATPVPATPTPLPIAIDDTTAANSSIGTPEEKQILGAKTIVLHFGSRNLRLGLASQAYPKVTPNVIAHRLRPGEQEPQADVVPVRDADASADDLLFGPEFKEAHATVYRDFRERMRFYKRRVVPNSHELVVSYNKRVRDPETIPDHNDPGRIEWTEPKGERYITGARALRIPEGEGYVLRWPIQHGMFNETDYSSAQELLGDVSLILVDALERELGISFKEYEQYNVVLLIPDLFQKTYVESMITLILQMGLANVCVLQESMGATFGAGVSTACVIDVGAQTTKISCIEEGMIIPESRVNLKYGGDDVTLALTKLLLKSSFPYQDINLARPYDLTLADELKHKYSTMNDADITVQHYSFYQRAPTHAATKKFEFKTFEEVMLAPLGFFYPDIFDQPRKRERWCTKSNGQKARYSLFPRSVDIYEEEYGDPMSGAQVALAKGTYSIYAKPAEGETAAAATPVTAAADGAVATPSEAPGDDDTATTTTTTTTKAAVDTTVDDDALQSPLAGLDHAIIESITQAVCQKTSMAPGPVQHASTLQLQQNFYENLLIVGGAAAKVPGFNGVLTDRIAMWLSHAERTLKPSTAGAPGAAGGPGGGGVSGDILVMPAPREMDPQVLTWKGGGVFAKLKIVNECWISARDWDMLGARSLQYKSLFAY